MATMRRRGTEGNKDSRRVDLSQGGRSVYPNVHESKEGGKEAKGGGEVEVIDHGESIRSRGKNQCTRMSVDLGFQREVGSKGFDGGIGMDDDEGERSTRPKPYLRILGSPRGDLTKGVGGYEVEEGLRPAAMEKEEEEVAAWRMEKGGAGG